MSETTLTPFSKFAAYLALALSLLGSVQPEFLGPLAGGVAGGSASCVDMCGCPPSGEPSCCCEANPTGPATGFNKLVSGFGCTPPSPSSAPASPAGPLQTEWADVVLVEIASTNTPGVSETYTPDSRSQRPPVPPPRS